jgi:hypothetical protein
VSTILAILVCAGSGGAVSVEAGRFVPYDPGAMERVARNRETRGHPGYVPGFQRRYDVDGWAASVNCSDIGRVLWASLNGNAPERFQVVDCSAPRDRARHIRSGLVIEVDHRSAVRNGFAPPRKIRATVWRNRE